MDFRFRQVNHKETTRRDGSYDFITLEIFDRRKVMIFPLAVRMDCFLIFFEVLNFCSLLLLCIFVCVLGAFIVAVGY